MKRKGRSRRRFLKRGRDKRNVPPIFNGYDLRKLIDHVIELKRYKIPDKTLIGTLIHYRVNEYTSKNRFCVLEIEPPEGSSKFYFITDDEELRKKHLENFSRYYHPKRRKYNDIDNICLINYKLVKIKRVLSLEEALIYKLTYSK